MKYRTKSYDIKNDIYLIQKKWFGCLWITFPAAGVGKYAEMKLIENRMNGVPKCQ